MKPSIETLTEAVSIRHQIDAFERRLSSLFAGGSEIVKPSVETLTEAISLRQQIDALERRLSSLFTGGDPNDGQPRKRRPISTS
jgi:polyhydroxyalkanoate synthesis regulator phasin